MAIVYDNLAKNEDFQQAINSLYAILDMVTPCINSNLEPFLIPSAYIYSYVDPGFIKRCDNYSDVIGPNSGISKQDCEEFVYAISRDMRRIVRENISNSPNSAALEDIINQLESKAVACCRAGNFWKACLTPIVRKRLQWIGSQKKFGEILKDFIYTNSFLPTKTEVKNEI